MTYSALVSDPNESSKAHILTNDPNESSKADTKLVQVQLTGG